MRELIKQVVLSSLLVASLALGNLRFLTPIGSPHLAPAFVNNQSLFFSRASNQYVDLGTSIRIQPNQPISTSAWIYLVTSNTGAVLSNLDANYGMDFGIIGINGGPQLRFEMYGNTGAVVASTNITGGFPVNQWLHVAETYDGSNTTAGIKLYINAVEQTGLVYGGTGISGGITYTEHTKIGRDFYEGTTNGYVDEVAVVFATLTPTQITSIYNNGVATDLTGLPDHWYRADGDTGTTVIDHSGTVNGTMVSGAQVASFAPFFIPQLLSSTRIKNDPSSFQVSGKYVYIPYYQAGDPDPGFDAPDLDIYDAWNPNAPSLVGTVPNISDDSFHSVFLAAFAPGNNRYLYLVYYKKGFLRIVDVLDPAHPNVVGALNVTNGGLPFNGNSIAFSTDGNYAYVAGSANIAAVVNISDKTNPSLVSTFVPGTGDGGDQWAFDVVKGNYMYYSGDTARTLSVYDISTPSTPSLITKLTTVLAGYSMFLGPLNDLYLSGYAANVVQAVDISSQGSPVVQGHLSVGGAAYSGLGATGKALLYTIGDTTGSNFSITSVWDPANPFRAWITTLSVEGQSAFGSGLIISGKYAYLVCAHDTGEFTGAYYGYLQVWQIAP